MDKGLITKSIGIELTEKCNFACVHCYLERKINPKLNPQAVDMLAEAAGAHGYNSVYITGGEPMINPMFLDVYRSFRLRGFLTSVYSNGAYLSDDIMGAFDDLIPHRVEITLYGMSERTYEQVVGSRSLGLVQKNIALLLSRGIEVFLKFNILTLNKHEFEAFLDYCSELGCDYSVNAQIIPKNNGDKTPIKYRLQPEEIAGIGRKHGIDFAPGGDGYDRCDVGENIFVDSQGRVRGCPVLFTEVDQNIFSSPWVNFEEIERLFVSLRQAKSGKYCPAWTMTEGESAVGNFLEELKRYAN